MRTIAAFWSVFFMVVAAAVPVSAQGLTNFECDSGTGLLVGKPTVFGGWASDFRLTFSASEALPEAGVGIDINEYRPEVSSVYLGTSVPVLLGDMGTLVLTAAAAIPSTNRGEECQFVPAYRSRVWDAGVYWGTMEALLVYPAGGVSLLGGFRWDSWQYSWKNPSIAAGPWASSASTDTLQLTLNSYLPFFGLGVNLDGLSIGVIGLPIIMGEFEQRQTQNGLGPRAFNTSGKLDEGYFVEIFFEYALPFPAVSTTGFNTYLSIFGKFNALEGKTIEATAMGRPPVSIWPYSFVFRRSVFVVGGKAEVEFDWSGLFPF